MLINLASRIYSKNPKLIEFLKILTTFIDNTHAINLNNNDKQLLRQYFTQDELKHFYKLAIKYKLIIKIPKEVKIDNYEYSTSIIPNPFNYYSQNIGELLKARYRYQALLCKLARLEKTKKKKERDKS